MSWLLLSSMLLFGTSAAGAVTLDWVQVDDPGNAADEQVMVCCENKIGLGTPTSGYGSVPHSYRIMQTELPTWAYVEFLNAVARSDPNELYNYLMGVLAPGTIVRSGAAGSYTYQAKPGREDEPVVYVDWYRAARFANWLHNGQPTGAQGPTTTEDGAYSLDGANPIGVPRNPGATHWIPTEDEWYKAAYHVPGGGYVDYATGSDDPPAGDPPPGAANSANYCPPEFVGAVEDVCPPEEANGPGVATPVGAYPDARSPWGIQDGVGNVIELMEEHHCCSPGTEIRMAPARGGFYTKARVDNAAFGRNFSPVETDGCNACGFRLATLVPEPAAVALQVLALAAVAACARPRRTCAARGGHGPRTRRER